MTTKNKSGWTSKQVRAFVRHAIDSIGGRDAWLMLVPTIQSRVIEAYALTIVLSQERESIELRRIGSLVSEMLVEAGVNE